MRLSGHVVKDASKEMGLHLRIEELEDEVERGQTGVAILREGLDEASVRAR